MSWFRNLGYLFRRDRLNAEMAEEMAHHVELLTEQNRRAGLSEAEARSAALREFGNVGSVQGRVREQRGWLAVEAALRDLRQALRGLRHQPGFAAVVVLTLALGIGANAAIFTLVNAVLFRPLAVHDEDRLVVLQTEDRATGGNSAGLSYLNFADWRAGTTSFSGMAAVAESELVLMLQDRAVRVRAALVSPEFFPVAGIQPLLGRSFLPAEELPGGLQGVTPAMLTHATWVGLFNADPAVIGRQLEISEMPCEIVGVTPAGLFPVEPEPVDIWLPPVILGDPAREGSANASRAYRPYIGALARLRPGVSLGQAQAELEALHVAIRTAHPEIGRDLTVRISPLRALLVGDHGPKLGLLAAVVGLVLLIACLNVANLLLSRAITRQRELAVRSALGASRRDLIRQAMAETFVLATLGGGFGLLLAAWMIGLAETYLPEGLPRLAGLVPEGRVLLFCGGVVVLTGLFCGWLPALVGGTTRPIDALKAGGRGSSGGRHNRLRHALVVGQIALSLALLVAAGLMLRSLGRLQQVQPGYQVENILTAQIALTGQRYMREDFEPTAVNHFMTRLTEALARIPGVSAVSHAQSVPLTGVENNTSYAVVEVPTEPGSKPSAQLRFVAHDYLDTLGIPVVAGRGFTAHDGPAAPAVALVNEAFVREALAGRNPLGLHLRMGWGGFTPKEIVGVVADVRHRSPGDTPRPEVYVPQAQFANAGITLVVRTAVRPEALAESIRREVWRLDPGMPVTEIRALADYRERALSGQRLAAVLLGLFSGTALVLTLVGLYGVMSHHAASRRQEMGIRAALGARPAELYRLMLGQGIRLAVMGIGLGLVLAAGLARLLRSQLYDVSAVDPLTYGALSGLVLLATLLATLLPARRAAKADPMVALRAE
ncbi:Macrolide export ATP-binding/permease protein MacB [Lacunisphaera limnophila]|uniref:Macrolide export ATP-binding/permease protein MacB n=1 Tax=Lacunisphaera limnophila TaxID=1838286 RepID=A0A1D8AYT4_9BACT|nr:ABC transporter permease [Lacunisphaera limnophila]AOS46021.1 Macrolide export ATP-binding/permease protein MacB [Lacunisphaera limnophila]